MLDKTGKVIYVGKAKNLKNRVSSYFRGVTDPKTARMVSLIDDIQITITRSEVEALLLEFQLIRELKPRYNILFRDDKSYPYIHVTSADDYPRLTYYRGDAKGKGDFYGPYPNGRAVRESIDLLQKTFQLRQCEDSYFKSRTRPCLQYQIKRCTAPCVGYIDQKHYAQDVRSVQLFLQGKTDQVIEKLLQKMEASSNNQDYEDAARLRDQIIAMREVQKHQIITPGAEQSVDVLGVYVIGRNACVHLINIREGRMLGSRQFFPLTDLNLLNDQASVLESFLLQHYLNLPSGNLLPKEILVSIKLPNVAMLEQALRERASKKIKVTAAVRNDRALWLKMAQTSAAEALRSRLDTDAELQNQFYELAQSLGARESFKRIECFDVSHTQGDSTIASCVVFEHSGPVRKDYRRFKIKTADAGDDYAAMEEALKRHFVKLQQKGGDFPDLLLIDGGKGQLSRAQKVSQELALAGVTILGIAKGRSRKPGKEKLFLAPEAKQINLSADSRALLLLQRVRDEAHRFAITGHRKQRSKRALHSVLEDIPGIGKLRRRELLRHFGGLQEVQCASVEELAAVSGISEVMAAKIYEALHGK